MIYLDYAASSVPFPEVIDRMADVSRQAYGNPGSLHEAGSRARKILHESRKTLARALSVRPEEVFFTSGGTEANNWAVRIGCAVPGKRHIVCSAAEHKSVLEPVLAMKQQGYRVTLLSPGPDGRIRPEAAAEAMGPDTCLLCVQAVNNETGVMQDVQALAEAAKRRGALYLCDGVQSFGHVDQSLHRADLVSVSAHKLGGPRGVGCLVIRQPHRAVPLLLGGGQEYGLRSGTENIPAIAGFALAARMSADALPEEQARLSGLCALLRSELSRLCPDVRFAGEGAQRSPILSCAVPGFSGEELAMQLDMRGICVSPGAACAARSPGPSHVLQAMGYTPKEAGEFLRLSPGRTTTESEIRTAAAAIADICGKRRGTL